MRSVVVDATTLVGALLKAGSIPERALLLARSAGIICLSEAVETEILDVFARPKFQRYLVSGRVERIVNLISSGASRFEPMLTIADCRD